MDPTLNVHVGNKCDQYWKHHCHRKEAFKQFTQKVDWCWQVLLTWTHAALNKHHMKCCQEHYVSNMLSGQLHHSVLHISVSVNNYNMASVSCLVKSMPWGVCIICSCWVTVLCDGALLAVGGWGWWWWGEIQQGIHWLWNYWIKHALWNCSPALNVMQWAS